VQREGEARVAGLDAVAIEPVGTPPKATVLLLHGFQMEPADLSPFARSLDLPVRFVLPAGPAVCAARGRAWWSLDEPAREAAIAGGPRDLVDELPPDLDAACELLRAMLDELGAASVGPLVLAGFSQGGMLAYATMARARHPAVAALALLSATRIGGVASAPPASLAGLPALVAHGALDPDLAIDAGAALRDALATGGAEVSWVPFEGAHEIPLVVWRALKRLVLARVR
jgi:phospholipase/carboxylesterase